MTSSPSSRPSPSLRAVTGSGCTSTCTHATLPGAKSSRSSGSCSDISGVPSSCSGTAGRSIGDAMSKCSFSVTRGWRCTASPATRPSSIRMSSSGRRPSGHCRTVTIKISCRSRSTSSGVCSGLAVHKQVFARVSPDPRCHGRRRIHYLDDAQYVAGMSDGWWLTPSGNRGPLIAISGHPGRTP